MADPVDFRLSEPARARMQAGLPALLGALRGRRRRRRLVRATAAVSLLAGAFCLWQLGAERSPLPAGIPVVPVAAEPRWTTVRDDPGVVARLLVPTTVRAEWFLDDQGLQVMLRDGDRPDGLVRAQGLVLVSAAAIDPFPMLLP